ncbi:hypothetical protein KFE25_010911 [Diacronema lutheri]|uniref:PDZ domain-containing protein n=1 Tax=Diacronema lutheri TaxID=2081491 RepID=A0A8J5X4N6_DIALT|nr:hypothetical protein KFE25_009788 [Diacronema lutheri]KAG8460856.1 hypothetical protein KFE25_010911 [Diacronema lutheri]
MDEDDTSSSFKASKRKPSILSKKASLSSFFRAKPKSGLAAEVKQDERQVFAKARRSGDESLTMTRLKGEKLGLRFDKNLVEGKYLHLVEVFASSLADRYGLVAGDLIETINGMSYADPVDAVQVLRATEGDIVLVLKPQISSGGALAEEQPSRNRRTSEVQMLWM